MVVAGYLVTRYQVGDQVMPGIPAVAAISFQRDPIITSHGIVRGCADNERVNSETFSKSHANLSEFQKVSGEHHKALISDALVFQFQALNSALKSFLVHICLKARLQTERLISCTKLETN